MAARSQARGEGDDAVVVLLNVIEIAAAPPGPPVALPAGPRRFARQIARGRVEPLLEGFEPGRQGIYRKPHGTPVIGVVSEVVNELRTQDAPTVYLPLAPTSVAQMVVRAWDDPRGLVRALHDAVQAADLSHRPTTAFAADGLQRELQGPTILALLATIVGATALGLAVIGLLGVTAFVVEQRRHELSVRKALGASNGHIRAMLFRDSLTPVAAGLALGILLSLLGGRVVQGVLSGVSSRDPMAILGAVVVLMSAAAAAILLPVRRASRVSPAQLLKQG
jgi:putative ABC transport system permease protein